MLCFENADLPNLMIAQSLFTLLISIVLAGCFLICVFKAISERSRIWKFSPYVIALIPVGVHARNYGFGRDTVFAVVLFLVLTKLIVFLAAKQWEES